MDIEERAKGHYTPGRIEAALFGKAEKTGTIYPGEETADEGVMVGSKEQRTRLLLVAPIDGSRGNT